MQNYLIIRLIVCVYWYIIICKPLLLLISCGLNNWTIYVIILNFVGINVAYMWHILTFNKIYRYDYINVFSKKKK